jgi:hypothetical protein
MSQQEIQERRQSMFKLVEEYLASGQSLLKFSKEHNIPKTTFQSWHKKYMRKDKPKCNEKLVKRFMPIQVSQSFTGPLSVELYYPNGICLKLGNLTEIGQINQLIQSYTNAQP